MTSTEQVRPRTGSRLPQVDGATLVTLYLAALLIIPARLIISKIPITLPPALAIGLALGLLWSGAQLVGTLRMGKGSNLVRLSLALYLCAHLMTYAVATRRGLPVDELRVADSSMIRIIGAIAVAVFLCDGLWSRTRIDRVVTVLVAATAVVAFIGVVQFAAGFDIAAYINLPGLSIQENAYSSIESRSLFRRPAGTTNHPIEFGIVCVAALPLAVYLYLRARDLRRPALRWLLCIGLTAIGAMLALSRTAIIGLVLGGVVLLIAMPDRRKYAIGAVAGAGLAASAAVIPGMLGTLVGLFSNLSGDSSISHRTSDYPVAWAQVDLHPILGRGFGTYLPAKYQILDNQYLLGMVENGYLGLAALIGVLLAAMVAAVIVRQQSSDPHTRILSACLLAGLCVIAIGAATFDLLSFSVATGVTFVLVGLSGALLRAVRRESAEAASISARPPETSHQR